MLGYNVRRLVYEIEAPTVHLISLSGAEVRLHMQLQIRTFTYRVALCGDPVATRLWNHSIGFEIGITRVEKHVKYLF